MTKEKMKESTIMGLGDMNFMMNVKMMVMS